MSPEERFRRRRPLVTLIVLGAAVTILMLCIKHSKERHTEELGTSLFDILKDSAISIQASASRLKSLTLYVQKTKSDDPISVTDKQRIAPFKRTFPWQDIAYKRVNGSWVSDDTVCISGELFDQAILKTPAGNTPIFIHDVQRDHSVSRFLKETGNWEPDVMYTAFEVLKENKDHVFVDIGGNIGTFSLAAAKLGNRVISVEPYPLNTVRLCRGVMSGGFAGRMFIVNNAMSDRRESITFTLHPGDRAMTRTAKASRVGDTAGSGTTILLDDVLELFDFKSAVLKMDCEDCEWRVLTGSRAFFDEVDVRMVLIEWDKLIRNPHAPEVIGMMARYGLVPYDMGKYDKPLDASNYRKWTNRNIVFKKISK